MPKNFKPIIIIVLAFLVLVIYPLAVLPIKDLVHKIIYPLANGLTGISDSLGGFFTDIRSIGNLTVENKQLKEENIELRARLEELKETEHENKILQEELGFVKEEKEKKLIPAQIVGYSPSGFLQTLKLNKGSESGISQGQPVISHGYLVGVILQASSNASEVFLITNSNSLIPVALQESRGTGLLQGGLQGMTVREIPADSQVAVGEGVLTSGLGGNLPAGIPVGKVEKIISKESEIFQKVSIHSPIDFGKLEVVFIFQE